MRITIPLSTLMALALAAAPAAAQNATPVQGVTARDRTEHGVAHSEPERIEGTFEGAEGRNAIGSYRILSRHGVRQLVLSDDFAVQDEPDIWVVLSPAPYIPRVGGAVYLGPLTHLSGAQRFTIPVKTDLGYFGYILLWCRRFGMPVGQAYLVVGLDKLLKE